MSDDPWLPPRRGRDAGDHFGDPTPATSRERSHEPVLREIQSDDEAVAALTSSTPPNDADPLPPLDDEFVTPVHIVDLSHLDPDQANAKLKAAAPERSQSERLYTLELANTKLRLDVDNLTTLVKDLLRRSAG